MKNVKFDLTAVLQTLFEEIGKVAIAYIQRDADSEGTYSEE